MMIELDYTELEFAKAVPEPELLAEMGHLLEVDPTAMWDWRWPGEPAEDWLVNVTYVADNAPDYPLFVSLNFNETREVSLGFEIEFGVALAQRFGCVVLIGDPSDPHGSPDRLLEIQPSGQVRSCEREEDSKGQRMHPSVKGLSGSYREAIAQLEALVQRVGKLPWMGI